MSELVSALTERFFRYVAVSSQSDAAQPAVPSSPGQLELARLLAAELRDLGLSDVHIDEHGILTARRPGERPTAPKVGFVAHLDTVDVGLSPDVKPQVLRFSGEPLCLNREQDLWLLPQDHPALEAYRGEDLIFTDGTSVLGADNKAGVAIVMQLLAQLRAAPLPCGDLYVAFVPDEEIGLRGAKKLDLGRFPVDFAYTIDGAELGELVYETFHAGRATVTIRGVPAHPISAKGVLVNPVLVAHDLIGRFDRQETPEHTEGREGYFYITDLHAGPGEARLHINIRDFDQEAYAARKRLVEEYVRELQAQHPRARISCELEDVYGNILDAAGEDRRALTLLEEAFRRAGVTPQVKPMRGGTDGSALSARGVFTPNYFTGAHNLHSNFECLPLSAFVKSYEVTEALVRLSAEAGHAEARHTEASD